MDARRRVQAAVLACALSLAAVPATAGADVTYTPQRLYIDDTVDVPEDRPRTDGRYVVWQVNEPGKNSIVRRDLATGMKVTVSGNTVDNRTPDVDGGVVVWENYDSGTGKRTLRWYDSTGEHFYDGAPYKKMEPAIDGHMVVFESDAAGQDELWVLDISDPTPVAVQITGTPGVVEALPDISGDRIVYEDDTNGDIRTCDLSGGNNTKISITPANPLLEGTSESPRIDGDHCVWEWTPGLAVPPDDDREIYHHDFVTGESLPLTGNTVSDSSPAIGNGTVAWLQAGGGISGAIRTYEFATDEEAWAAPGSTWTPSTPLTALDVAGGRIVWNDGREGRWDVYAARRRCVVERIPTAATDRFGTAVAMAEESYDAYYGQWPTTLTHVVVASGDDAAAADPLSAAGLCWAYDAPLLLTSATKTPGSTLDALKDIKANNAGIQVLVVGGATSVPAARISEMEAVVGAGKVKRLLATGSRYDMAAKVSATMRAAQPAKVGPEVLFANGADASKFFDALALSAISRYRGAPILLVAADKVPAATTAELAALDAAIVDPLQKVIGGGPNTVSEAVRVQLGVTPANRWYGQNRYATAVDIANEAIARRWAKPGAVGVAAKVPDALAGGCLAGRENGVLLVTSGNALSTDPGAFVLGKRWEIADCWILGGTLSVTNAVKGQVQTQLDK